jgi:hypothetical protein
VTFDTDAAATPLVQSLTDEVIRTMFTTPHRTKVALVCAGFVALTAAAFTQGPPPQQNQPPVPRVNPPATIKEEPPRPFIPFGALSQAKVTWTSDEELTVRIERPCGRFLTLLDAAGKKVHVHDGRHLQSKAEPVAAAELKVLDLAGNEKPAADWKKLFREEKSLLYVVEEQYDLKLMRKEFGPFLKDDVLILVASKKVDETFNLLAQFEAIQSFPQVFPGQPPVSGGPVPPPKK